jgi:anhydro-N-acetylmuramic acid kinase|tara:strand:- start:6411 stop:7487 length:1077 start_codon:yes stop_codon:yes gene_type:complete
MNTVYDFSIGLMSGTSLDGLDLVYVKFNIDDYQDFEIIHTDTIPYSEKWKTILQKSIDFSASELTTLDLEYGQLLAERVSEFIEKYAITKIDFIASHGHTVLHQPEKEITLQIGNGQVLANKTKHKVVCDFRTQDVVLGGQGAPLVPIGDALLFSEYDYCINLGGFSNVSYQKNEERIAFDICPVNIVMNFYVSQLGFDYDEDGALASKGGINELLLDKLNDLSFYKKKHPKSLGLEWVQQEVFPLIDEMEAEVPNILRTFVEHVAFQISNIVEQNAVILFTGGGVFNSFLMSRIAILSSGKTLKATNEMINYKEALVFAFLGLLKIKNEINCLKSVTGASKNHSSGVVFYPSFYERK